MCYRFRWILPALIAWPALAAAGPLSVVNVGAPAINCVFNPSCTITVSDTAASIPLPGISGTAQLQSRTFIAASGAAAAGHHGYQYRVDLTGAVGITNIPCVKALRVAFGPVAAFQYNGAGPTDHVYVVTSGGIGSIGLSSASQVGDEITFTFATPVCAGGSPGTGATSFFFGLTSATPPTAVTAVVSHTAGPDLSVGARSPGHGKCTTGVPLSSVFDPCVSSICAIDPFCCTSGWDGICVGEARTICGSLACAEASGTCGHSLCTTGAPLVNLCDSGKANCVSSICAVDPFCCTSGWDSICVSEVEGVCGKNCD